MTREEAIEKLNQCHTHDKEADHSNADDILCELLKSLGYEDVVKAWDAVDKWYA